MRASETIDALAAALAAAQATMAGAQKNATNPHFRSSYSDLTSVIEAVRKPLADNGLSYVQGLGEYRDGCLSVTTRLMHASGQWLETTTQVPVAGKQINAQALGSAASYGRRYALQSMVGVPSVDDDGNAATAAPAEQPAAITADQAAGIKAECEELSVDVVKFLQALGVPSIDAMPASHFSRAQSLLARKRKAVAA